MAEKSRQVVSLKPISEGVSEIGDITAEGGIVELGNGSWLLAQGGQMDETWAAPVPATWRVSKDRGKSWSEPKRFDADVAICGLIKLKSGALAAYGRKSTPGNELGVYFYKSTDDGKTWTDPTPLVHTGHLQTNFHNHVPLYHNMIQLSTGRLLYTAYLWFGGWDFDTETRNLHPDLQYKDVMTHGLWRGQKIDLEGHGHGPEMGVSVVYRSDDEGKTWKKHAGILMGWFDSEGIVNGNGGQTPCYEPTIAETKDGNVLLVARFSVGRLVQSFSTDGGEHWYAVTPMDLSSSESPAMMVTLPKTGDLLIVWNQVSREEIRRGYRRGRFSSAISSDGGHSWKHFKTLELSEGLEDIDRVSPEYPIQMVRGRDVIGPLPDGWAYFHYANIDAIGDKVILRYNRGGPLLGLAEQNLQKQETVMRVYPTDWFYR